MGTYFNSSLQNSLKPDQGPLGKFKEGKIIQIKEREHFVVKQRKKLKSPNSGSMEIRNMSTKIKK